MRPFAKNILLAVISLTWAAVICQFRGDDWEEKLRQSLYRLTNDSIPNYAKTLVDEKGIPYVHYAGNREINPGNQYNPTIVSNYAIDYYESLVKKKDPVTEERFIHCIHWLLGNIRIKGSYALYEFNWKQPFYDSVGVPWTSGMTSGRAIEAFTAAYALYGKLEYLDAANSLLRGFYQPIRSGGFTYKEPPGWWYEEFADSNMHTPRILDGHIYALTGVYKFWQLTKKDSAWFVVQQGITTLKHNLPAYDAGNGWSYYDAYHAVSDKTYHILLTGQMKQLWEMTKDPLFADYYHAWQKPLNKPYVYRIIKEKNRSGLILYFLVSSMLFAGLYLLYHRFKNLRS